MGTIAFSSNKLRSHTRFGRRSGSEAYFGLIFANLNHGAPFKIFIFTSLQNTIQAEREIH